MEITDSIPGTPVPQSDPATSSFVQSALAAASINQKPEPSTVKTADPKAPAKAEAKPAKEAPKAEPAKPAEEAKKEESAKTEKPPKINIRKLAKGELEEEAPAGDAAPEASEEIPAAIKSSKAADEWKKLKAERDALKAELAAKSKPADEGSAKTLLEQLQKERDELSAKLRELDIERHPEFQNKYQKRITSIEGAIKSTVGEKGDRFLALLKLPDSETKAAQIDAIVEELGAGQRTKLGGYIAQYETAQAEKAFEIEAAKGSWAERQAKAQQEAEQAKLREVEDVEQSWKAALLSAADFEPYQIDESDPESAAHVGQLVEGARSIYMGLNNNQSLARAALAAAAVQPMREALYAQIELNKRLAAENKKLKGAGPKVQNQKPVPATQKKGFIETVLGAAGR